MKQLNKQVCILILVMLIIPVRQVLSAETGSISDFRILIDVSGSMKKNDPNNLRVPALRLVLGLLPDNAEAGVWTFSTSVNNLVPHQGVDEAWKKQAKKQSQKIHSRGLFTNIELALKKATEAKKNQGDNYNRNIILLSDGLVDVSKTAAVSQQSRQRIIDELIPQLKEANIAVHTIALSDTADHELLRAISLATDGWYEQVDSADSLQRVFLHVFEKAATRDTVPLLDNNFKIDESVSEMTLLVFRREGTEPTALILPDKSRMVVTELPENVHWQSEDHYDLITVTDPIPGRWQIDAEVDPDNRVMVVTDLQLYTTRLPNTTLLGEVFDFEANLTEQGETIVKAAFLDLVDAQLVEEPEGNDPKASSLNTLQQEGVYRTHIGDNFKPGRNDIVVVFKSATFERERRQRINVVDTQFDINVEQLTKAATRTHRLSLKPDTNFISTDNLSIAAMLTADDGSEWSYDVMKTAGLEWQLTLADLQKDEQYRIALQIKGETLKGRSLFLQPEPIILNDETVVHDEIEMSVDEPVIDELVVLDEMSGDDELLPEIAGDELLDFNDEANDTDVVTEGESSQTVTLAIGNGVILLLVLISIFMWRRKVAARKNPGDLL